MCKTTLIDDVAYVATVLHLTAKDFSASNGSPERAGVTLDHASEQLKKLADRTFQGDILAHSYLANAHLAVAEAKDLLLMQPEWVPDALQVVGAFVLTARYRVQRAQHSLEQGQWHLPQQGAAYGP